MTNDSRITDLQIPEIQTSETIAETAARNGIDRRGLLRWAAAMAGLLAVPALPFAEEFAAAATTTPRLPVLWLNGQDCNGDTESFLRTAQPTPTQLIMDYLSLDYSELLMAPAGDLAEARLASTLSTYSGSYVLVIEGSIPTGASGAYCCVGGRSFVDIVKQFAAGALVVIAVGTCATDGGLPLATGGTTGATSVTTALSGMGKTIINLPGCPMNPYNLAATLTQYISSKTWPTLDSTGRPTFAYGTRIHSRCPRLSFYRAGQYVRAWGDAGHQAGWCLRYVGCQGPQTSSNCPTALFNSATSFPIASGAPCLGCVRSTFWSSLSNAFTWTPTTTAVAAAAALAPATNLTQSTADVLVTAL